MSKLRSGAVLVGLSAVLVSDAVTAQETSPCIIPNQVIRNEGSPLNPEALRPDPLRELSLGDPVGFEPFIDHTSFMADADLDILILGSVASSPPIVLPEGNLLIAAPILVTWIETAGTPFSVAFPNVSSTSLIGVTVSFQGASLRYSDLHVELTNALDVTLGWAHPAPEPTFVLTAQGAIRGNPLSNGVHEYLGIPYAAPLTPANRWKAPGEPACWTGIVDRKVFGPACPQYESQDGQDVLVGQEDCLTLNVWAPEDANGLPVIVYLHGGSHWHGSSAAVEWGGPAYGGETLAERGAVVVTINYRLGLLGFLAHSDLGAESPGGSNYRGGNYGIMDQLAALRWVQQNIAAFGGDPANVTAWGQSGGSADLCVIVASPEGAGLLSGAFFQSGGCVNLLPMTTPEAEANEIAGILNHPVGTGAVAGLRSETVEVLFDAALQAGSAKNSPRRWMPVVDDYILKDLAPAMDPGLPVVYPMGSFDDPLNDTPMVVIEAGLHNEMPLMISTTIEEPINSPPSEAPLQELATLQHQLAVQGFFDAIRFAHQLDSDPLWSPVPPSDDAIFAWLKALYSLEGIPPGSHAPADLYEAQLTEAYYDMWSDAVFLTRSRTESRAFVKGNGAEPVWRALFGYTDSAAPLGAFGAGHSVDNYYYFDRLGKLVESESPLTFYTPGVQDVELAEWMQDNLIRFAATGDPNELPVSAPEWRAYVDDGGMTDKHMLYGVMVGSVMKGLEGDGFRTPWCDLWEWLLTPVVP